MNAAGFSTSVDFTVIIVPEPQENVWQFMRDNWLSNRVFTCYDNLVNHWCEAWNTLTDRPWRIMSLGLRDWAYGF